MEKIIKALKFNNRIEIISSGIITKIIGLANVFFLTYFLLPKDYGNLTYVQSTMNLLIPILGFGLNHSLIRFGDSNDKIKTNALAKFVTIKGGLITLGEMIFFLLAVKFLNDDFSLIILASILSFQLIFTYLLRIMQSKMRLEKRNKDYAKTLFTSSITLFLFLVIGYFTFGFMGTVLGYTLYPLATLLIFTKKDNRFFQSDKSDDFTTYYDKIEIFKYGIFVGLGSVASQMLHSLDIIMIKNILVSSESVAIYKVASLFSVNGLIFCNNIMSADYVYIKEMENKRLDSYTKTLVSKLLLISIVITVLSIPLVYFASHEILDTIYKKSFIIHLILMLGFVFSFSMKIPFGSILSARGYANYNMINTYVSLGMNLILNIILINLWGYFGAAIATTFTMIFSAIFGLSSIKE